MEDTLTFVQISDTHIDASRETIAGVKPGNNLSRAVQDINDNFSHASFVIHTGDVANNGTAEDYQLYKSLVEDLNIPVHHLRGTHDHDAPLFRDMFLDGKDACLHWNFKSMDWHFVGLDSGCEWEGSRHNIAPEEMTWLHQLLLDNPSCPTVLFVHCHFYPAHSAFIDSHIMGNANELVSELSAHKCIRSVVTGHVHHTVLSFSEYAVISTPSLSWQFVPMAHSLAYDDVPPGYRVFEIDRRSNVFTYVRRLSPTPRNEFPVQLSTDRIIENP